MAVKNLAATLSSDFLAAISLSRTARSSSGSVPSMPICRPRLRKGSSMALTCASSASRPSLRAFSARLTRVWICSVAGGTLAGITAILGQEGDHRDDEPDQGGGIHGSALLAGREGDDGGGRVGLLRAGRRPVGAAVH